MQRDEDKAKCCAVIAVIAVIAVMCCAVRM